MNAISTGMKCAVSKTRNVKHEKLDGGTVLVEANLQDELCVHLHFRKLNYCLKCHVYKVISHVVLTLTVSKI